MKRILLVILVFILFSSNVYADDYYEYTEWSLTKTNYPGEQEKIQYGYMIPIRWSSWSPNNPHDLYQKSSYQPWPTSIPKGKDSWNSRNKQTLYSWPESGVYDEPKKLLEWYIDIDAYDRRTYDIKSYYEPKMELVCTLVNGENVVVGTTPGRGGNEHNLSQNMAGSGEYLCKKVTLNMVASIPSSSPYNNINGMSTVYSYVSFETLCYSYVIEWSDGMGWRDIEPYENVYGENPIKAVERTVYRHPKYYHIRYHLDGGYIDNDAPLTYNPENDTILPIAFKKGFEFIGFHLKEDLSDLCIDKINKGTRGDIDLYAEFYRSPPVIEVEKKYIYDDIDIDVIKSLARAYDEVDGDITDKIIIEEFEYIDSGFIDVRPTTFDATLSDKLFVTYSVTNSGDIKAVKKVIIYILRDGVFVDLKIYDRYIDKDYLDTLENNSIWRNDVYLNELKKYFDWLERN